MTSLKIKFLALLIISLTHQIINAQAPNKMSYQAVIRDANNKLVTTHAVGMRISIIQTTTDGVEVYKELFNPNPLTNANGLVTVEIGGGIPLTGTFAAINWANGPYFIKTETDPTGGTNYTVTSTSQLLSVPYAMHAKTAESISGTITETDPIFAVSSAKNIVANDIINWNDAYAWGNHAVAGYLKSFTETDPIFVASPANGITNLNITNWSSAYGWGNHASAGYLKSFTETDPIFVASPANGITSLNITNWNSAYGWGNHASAGYLKSYTETDPIFVASPANGITSLSITNWNSAYGWGNHASAGYLKSYTETDPIFVASSAKEITSLNITNWNSAYGWGNHAGLYRPVSYVPSWSEITSNPFSFASLTNNQLLKYNSTSGKWENWTPNFLTSYTETDPIWITASANYYTKTNMQTSGAALLHFGNLTNKPTTIVGYGITDAVATSGNQTIAGNKTLTGTTVFTGTTTVPTPVNATDAATKAYVDALKQQIKTLENNLITSGAYQLEDIEGNKYSVVKIGAQVWMAENLRTTKYADGTAIPLVNTTSTWDALTATSKAYCWYNDNIANKATYGALYTWTAAMYGAASVTANPSGVQGVCPSGWHLPSDAEWASLTTYLGGESVAGGKLKEIGTTYWLSPNTGATNETGFTALPGGYRYLDGTFYSFGGAGCWLSATENSAVDAWWRSMSYNYSSVNRDAQGKGIGISVRCVRD